MTAEFDISLEIGALRASLSAEQDWRKRCAGAMQQVPIVSAQVSGDGTIDQADALMAKTGYIWSVRRLTCSGFTAGTVTVYKNISGGEPVAPYPQAGMFTFGRGEVLLMPGERLVAVGTGIVGTFQLWGAADCFEQWYLPYYIG